MSTLIIFLDDNPIASCEAVMNGGQQEISAVYNLCEKVEPLLKKRKAISKDWFGNKTGDFDKQNISLYNILYRDPITYEPYVDYINWHMLVDDNDKEITVQIVEFDAIKNDKSLSTYYDYKQVLSKLNKSVK